jgi:bacterioferritin-associated ferredoxin
VIVCLCRDVSDAKLRDVVRAGGSVEDVVRATGAGTDCGCCVEALERIAQAARAEHVTIGLPQAPGRVRIAA